MKITRYSLVFSFIIFAQFISAGEKKINDTEGKIDFLFNEKIKSLEEERWAKKKKIIWYSTLTVAVGFGAYKFWKWLDIYTQKDLNNDIKKLEELTNEKLEDALNIDIEQRKNRKKLFNIEIKTFTKKVNENFSTNNTLIENISNNISTYNGLVENQKEKLNKTNTTIFQLIQDTNQNNENIVNTNRIIDSNNSQIHKSTQNLEQLKKKVTKEIVELQEFNKNADEKIKQSQEFNENAETKIENIKNLNNQTNNYIAGLKYKNIQNDQFINDLKKLDNKK